MTTEPDPEPRMFFLSGSPTRPSREFSYGWRGHEADPDSSFEVAPGVRVALVGTGDFLLPGGESGWGATIAVWAAAETPVPALEPADAEASTAALVAYLKRHGLLDGIDEKQCAAMALVFHSGFAAGSGNAVGKMRAAELAEMLASIKPGGTGTTTELPISAEYGTRLSGGGYQTWNTEPYITDRWPLAERIELERQHGKVWRRRIVVVEDWAEVDAP